MSVPRSGTCTCGGNGIGAWENCPVHSSEPWTKTTVDGRWRVVFDPTVAGMDHSVVDDETGEDWTFFTYNEAVGYAMKLAREATADA